MLKRKFLTALLALLMVIPCTITAFAANPTIDFFQTGSVSLTLHGSAPVSGATITLYKVADIDKTSTALTYTLTPDFAASGVKLDDFTDDAISKHLATFALQKSLTGIEKITNSMGIARFEALELGLYLAVQTGEAAGYYPIDPFLVSVPMTNSDGTDWLYDIDATPKIEVRPIFTDATELTVKKEWQDDGIDRPQNIKISLLCDGEVYDSVLLSEENGWLHTWKNLSTAHTWFAVESDVPTGYTAAYKESENAIIITNTAVEEKPVCESISVKKLWSDGDSPTRPTSVEVELLKNSTVFDTVTLNAENDWFYTWTGLDPDASWGVREAEIPEGYSASYSVENSSVTITNTAKTLIQTGQLNWPIPVLLCSGGALLAAGIAVTLRRRKIHEK